MFSSFCYLIFLELTKKIIFMDDAGRHAHSRSMLEVPIFWFIYSEPLLLDKHFQAKALSDMIIVVQSEPASSESHLHCNGNSLLMNLRLDSEHESLNLVVHLARKVCIILLTIWEICWWWSRKILDVKGCMCIHLLVRLTFSIVCWKYSILLMWQGKWKR